MALIKAIVAIVISAGVVGIGIGLTILVALSVVSLPFLAIYLLLSKEKKEALRERFQPQRKDPKESKKAHQPPTDYTKTLVLGPGEKK